MEKRVGSFLGSNVIRLFYHCPKCGLETYYYNNVLGSHGNTSLPNVLGKCPLCHSAVEKAPGYYNYNSDYFAKGYDPLCFDIKNCEWRYVESAEISNDSKLLHSSKITNNLDYVDLIFSSMKSLRSKIRQESIKNEINKLIVKANETTLPSEISIAPNSLTEYFRNIVTIELNIYSLGQQLCILEDEIERRTQDNNFEQFNRKKEYDDKNKELIQKINLLRSNLDKITANSMGPKPTFDLDIPQKPELQKPGLFNKKQIEESNKKLLNEYEDNLFHYNTEKEKYQNSLAEYEELVKQKKQEARIANTAEIEKLQNQIQANKQSLTTSSSVKDPGLELLENEKQELKELLKKLITCRAELYALNVLHKKYKNITAVSSFLEYFETKRCTALEGPDGAYNLFEMESRGNTIIEKLEDVLLGLDKIIYNQGKLLGEMKSINDELDTLNQTSAKMLESISHIAVKADEIADNTATIAENTNVIAYNTAKTAYYSKKNAELTNALGFLVALK